MKAYLVVTGLAFLLLVLAHVARIFAEGWQVARSPVFVLATLAAVAMCIWAVRLYRRLASHGSE